MQQNILRCGHLKLENIDVRNAWIPEQLDTLCLFIGRLSLYTYFN